MIIMLSIGKAVRIRDLNHVWGNGVATTAPEIRLNEMDEKGLIMAITSAEILGRIGSLNAAPVGSADHSVGQYQIKEIEAEWKLWLYQDAAEDLSTEVSDIIFRKAWSDGHSIGYEEVDSIFRELVCLVRSVTELTSGKREEVIAEIKSSLTKLQRVERTRMKTDPREMQVSTDYGIGLAIAHLDAL